MPEGDTIFRAARTLHRALAGALVTRFESVLPALTRVHDDAPLTGRTIERVDSRGQAPADALLRRPRAAHPHADERQLAHLPAGRALAAPAARHAHRRRAPTGFEAVGFNVPVAEFLRSDATRSATRSCARSGPTCSARRSTTTEAMRRVARARRRCRSPTRCSNQRVVAGIGNVYKSEVLFLCGVNPFAPVARRRRRAAAMLLGTARTHAAGERHDLDCGDHDLRGYRRGRRGARIRRSACMSTAAPGSPCRKCGTRIRVRAQGPTRG